MGILLTVLSAVATVGCFFNPVWGECSYIIVNIVRPNENVQGVLFPTIPAMVIAMLLAYLMHMGRRLPRPAGLRQPGVPLMVAIMCLLAVHLLIWRSGELVQWILDEFAPVVLLLLYATRFMGTPSRLHAQFSSILAGSAFVSGQALFVHYLRKQPRFMKEGLWGEEPSHGELWDAFHLYGGTHEKVDQWRLKGRGEGVWGNSNDLGMVSNWGVAGAIYLVRRKGRKLLRLLGLALLAVFGGTILLTGSRGSLLQLGITMWLIFIGGKRKALGIALLVVGLVGVLVVLPRLAPQRSDAGESTSERKQMIIDGVRFFVHNPIKGIGFMNFPDMASKTLMPHNVYVQCLSETGMLGGGMFFAMLFLIRRETAQSVKHFLETQPKSNLSILAQCISAIQLSFLVFLLFTNQFMRFTMALILTLAFPLHQIAVKEQTEPADDKGAEEGARASQHVLRPLPPDRAHPPGLPHRGPNLLEPHVEHEEEEEQSGARYVFDPSSSRVEVVRDDEED